MVTGTMIIVAPIMMPELMEMSNKQTFFEWQTQALRGLLVWGVGSTVVGAGLSRADGAIVRHIGLQAIGWGLIDLLLAVNGRRGARRQANILDVAKIHAAATRFRTIVAVNTLLDIGYVLGGARLACSTGKPPDRRGMGIGILLQGSFLLAYDLFLLRGAAQWLHDAARRSPE